MIGENRPVKRVLFVDDNMSFLDMLEKIFSVWSKGHWEFRKAIDGAHALASMLDKPAHLIVIDFNLPGMGGLDLLRLLHKKYPDIPKAFLSGGTSEANRDACLQNGATIFLNKPVSLEDMEKIYRALDELAEAQPEGGFRGMLWHAGLTEVLQIECLNRNSSILEILSGRNRGQVYIRNGSVMHAEAPDRKGLAAVTFLLGLRGGEFHLKPFTNPPEVTISCSLEALLMEAAQAKDELGANPLKSGLPGQDSSENEGETTFEKRLFSPDVLNRFLFALQRNTKDISQILGDFERMDAIGDKIHLGARQIEQGRFALELDKPPKDVLPPVSASPRAETKLVFDLDPVPSAPVIHDMDLPSTLVT